MNDPRQLFQSDARSQIPDFVLEKVVQSMSDSITWTFTLALIPIVLAVVVILFMGKSKAQIEQSPSKAKYKIINHSKKQSQMALFFYNKLLISTFSGSLNGFSA